MALDDYGSGYSNGDVLITGSYNFIKIDKSLIQNILLTQQARMMVESIVGYAHQNGIEVIGEGVESKEELQVLKAIGVDYAQGFYLAKPSFSLLPGDFWTEQ